MISNSYKNWRVSKSGEEPPSNETPERNLWFAVIERALKDYCFFFNKLSNTGQGQLINCESRSPTFNNDFNLKAINEFNRLRWFLFEKEPLAFNLTYLTEQLYDDGDSAASCIRKQAIMQFKLHFLTIEEAGRFVAITSYVRQKIRIEPSQAAEKESTLRYKKFRL